MLEKGIKGQITRLMVGDYEAKIYVNARKWYASVYRALYYQKITIGETGSIPYVSSNYILMEVGCTERDNLIQLRMPPHRPNYCHCEQRWKNILLFISFTPEVLQTAVSEEFQMIGECFWPGYFRGMTTGKRNYHIDDKRHPFRSRNVQPPGPAYGGLVIYIGEREKSCCAYYYAEEELKAWLCRMTAIVHLGHFMVRRINPVPVPFTTKTWSKGH